MFQHTCIMSVPEMALLWRQESCAEGEEEGGETRLGACSHPSPHQYSHTEKLHSSRPDSTHLLRSTHTVVGDHGILSTQEIYLATICGGWHLIMH